MAAKRTAYRRQPNTDNRYGQVYVYGNVARQPQVLPKKRAEAKPVRPKRRTSSQVKKNRRRALDMNPVYTGFLAVAAICAVLICVVYLQFQSNIVQKSENISALQEELADLTEENDTAYNAATDSVNLQEIRNKAMNELGMVYAAEGHVIEYESSTSDYVKQYNDIPSDGVLAKSKDVSK